MRNIYLAAIGLSAMLATGATAANADTASQATCTAAQQKVATALASDTSANHDAAAKESHFTPWRGNRATRNWPERLGYGQQLPWGAY